MESRQKLSGWAGASRACGPKGGSRVASSSPDPVVASLAQDIFKELSQIEACQGPMQMRLIPTLVSIMQAPADKLPAGLCAVSARGAGPPRGVVGAPAALGTWACLRGASVSGAEHPQCPAPRSLSPGCPVPDRHRPPRPVARSREEAGSTARLLACRFLSETHLSLASVLWVAACAYTVRTGVQAPCPTRGRADAPLPVLRRPSTS